MRIPRGTTSFIKRLALFKSDGTPILDADLGNVYYQILPQGTNDGATYTSVIASATPGVLGAWDPGTLTSINEAIVPGEYEFSVPNALLAAGSISNLIIIIADASQTSGFFVAARVEFELTEPVLSANLVQIGGSAIPTAVRDALLTFWNVDPVDLDPFPTVESIRSPVVVKANVR